MPLSSALPATRYPRAKILVIDDDSSILMLVKRQLENAGYVVLLAEDGIVGGRLALNVSPNLILLDVDMPYLSGYELAQCLKAEPITWDIPVVFLTSDKEVEERTIRLGAQAYIKKPLNVSRLLDTVALFTIDAAPSDLQVSCPPQNKF
jgi:CheY-like chemotaxis protein